MRIDSFDPLCDSQTALNTKILTLPFGAAQPHHVYLFTNRRANRLKVLVHDGFGLWLAARRLHQGQFAWSHSAVKSSLALITEQFDTLIIGLPWQRLGGDRSIRVV
jgi:transposase